MGRRGVAEAGHWVDALVERAARLLFSLRPERYPLDLVRVRSPTGVGDAPPDTHVFWTGLEE